MCGIPPVFWKSQKGPASSTTMVLWSVPLAVVFSSVNAGTTDWPWGKLKQSMKSFAVISGCGHELSVNIGKKKKCYLHRFVCGHHEIRPARIASNAACLANSSHMDPPTGKMRKLFLSHTGRVRTFSQIPTQVFKVLG